MVLITVDQRRRRRAKITLQQLCAVFTDTDFRPFDLVWMSISMVAIERPTKGGLLHFAGIGDWFL